MTKLGMFSKYKLRQVNNMRVKDASPYPTAVQGSHLYLRDVTRKYFHFITSRYLIIIHKYKIFKIDTRQDCVQPKLPCSMRAYHVVVDKGKGLCSEKFH